MYSGVFQNLRDMLYHNRMNPEADEDPTVLLSQVFKRFANVLMALLTIYMYFFVLENKTGFHKICCIC